MRAARHARHTCAQNADHLAHNSPFSPVYAEVDCTLGTTPTKTTLGLPQNGGNGVIRTTTRRRHAASQALMVQNPHRHRHGGRRRDTRAWPDNEPKRRANQQHARHHWCGGRRRDLPQCRWAVAGPGRASSRRAERSSQRGRLAGGPPPTGTHSGRAIRRPEYQRGHKQPGPTAGAAPHHRPHTHKHTRINAGAAQTHSLRGPGSFRDDVAQSLTA